jgi:hypothetical protein
VIDCFRYSDRPERHPFIGINRERIYSRKDTKKWAEKRKKKRFFESISTAEKTSYIKTIQGNIGKKK